MSDHQLHDATLSADILQAVDRGEIRVSYLPIVALADCTVIGVEALARWHRGDEILSAQAFLDAAMKTGAIVPIGTYVMREACSAIARWNRANPDRPPLRVSVNASLHQLLEPSAVTEVERLLSTSGLPPGQLCIEMSEDALSELGEAVTPTLEALKDLGVRLSVDDFGTGASSLVALQRHRFDELKIDRSFVARMDEDKAAAAIVRGVAMLAGSLDLELVAEGVERPSQEQMLRGLRCDAAQGWLYAKPSEALDEVVIAAEAAAVESLARRPVDHDELWAGLPTAQAAARFIEAVFETAPIGMILIDDAGRTLAANPAATSLLGHPTERLVEMACWEIVHPADLQADLDGMDRLLRGECTSYVVEERVVAEDGTLHWVEVTVSGVPGDTKARGFPTRLLRQVRSTAADRALRDAHRALETHVGELGMANDRLASFAATLTHDLLQPVAAVDGFLTLLDLHAVELDEEHRDWLRRAIRGKERVAEAISALHRAATEDTVELSPVSLGSVVAEVAADCVVGAEDLLVSADDLPIVLGDRGLLAQVLANLFQNTLRYRGEATPRVEVSARPDRDAWKVTVVDNGRGIDPDELDAVFERGRRGRSAEATVGTGTGLATVRSLVRRMGGDAWAEPYEGGACIALRLKGAAGD